MLPGRSGLVADAEDPAAFGAAMVRLFDDPALLAAMSARAVDNARRHSWERLLERLFQGGAGNTEARSRHAGRAGSARKNASASPAAIAAVRRAAPAAPALPAPPLGAAELEMQSTIARWHDRQS